MTRNKRCTPVLLACAVLLALSCAVITPTPGSRPIPATTTAPIMSPIGDSPTTSPIAVLNEYHTTPIPTAPAVCVVTADVLHLRTGPGIEYRVIGWLYSGDALAVLTPGAWAQVQTSTGAYGWINSLICEVRNE